MRPGDRRATTYLLLLLVVLVWASYPALAKVALRDMPPFTLAALRCTLASALLVLLLLRERGERNLPPLRPELGGLVFLGLAGITCSTAIYYLAVALTTASNAAILTAATPVLVALGAHVGLGERLGRRQWAGVGCCALGVVLTVTRGELRLLQAPPSPGDGLALLAQVTWAGYTLYGRRVLVRLSPLAATAGAYLTGTAVLIPLAVVVAPAFRPARLGSPAAWAVVVFQGTVGTFSHIWYYRGVQTVGPAVTAVFMNLQPLAGLGLAALVVGERVTLAQGAGVAAILAGVWLTTRR